MVEYPSATPHIHTEHEATLPRMKKTTNLIATKLRSINHSQVLDLVYFVLLILVLRNFLGSHVQMAAPTTVSFRQALASVKACFEKVDSSKTSTPCVVAVAINVYNTAETSPSFTPEPVGGEPEPSNASEGPGSSTCMASCVCSATLCKATCGPKLGFLHPHGVDLAFIAIHCSTGTMVGWHTPLSWQPDGPTTLIDNAWV